MRLLDLTNKKFGKLTVIGRAPNRGLATCWYCKCDCGSNEKRVESGHLRNGRTVSCGCEQYQFGEKHRSWKGYKDIPQSAFRKIKDNAKSRNHSFDITIKYVWKLFINQNRQCALSGLPLDFNYGGRDLKHLGTASLDRIDSTKGYVKGNVQWVHKDINFMKQEYELSYFLELCQRITDFNHA